jgi:dihydroorotase
VNEGATSIRDILIVNGRIEAIGSSLQNTKADKTIDASGLTILPGMIDDQVHFREPGMTQKADIATESRAAVAGGITSFMDMPNTIPNTLTAKRLEEKYQLAANKSMANYGFYFGASNDNLEDIKRLDPRSACGIKVFMGASTGNMLVDNPQTLEKIFEHAPTLVATHCEDTPTILANEEKMRAQYGDEIPFELHPQIRSTEACVKSSTLAIDLANRFGTRLHVLHISTAEEVAAFASGPITRKQITAEACVHFLHFSSDDYAQKGALIKCNPAIKTPADRDAIISGLLEDRLDLIGTDHAPHTLEEKHNSYFNAPSGLPLVQYALLAVLEHYHTGRFSLPFIAHKPATL